MSNILNGFFSPVLDVIETHGGEATRFNGDAVLAIFPAGDRGMAAAIAAAESVLRSAQTLPAVETLAGPVVVQASVGVGAGRIVSSVARVGDRWVPIVGGEAINRATGAEQRADAGTLFIDRSGREASSPTPRPPFREIDPALTVDPAIAAKLQLDPAAIDEHRTASIAFAELTVNGRPLDPEELATELEQVHPTIEPRDGSVLSASTGEKGSYLLIAFGVLRATEHPALHAAATALTLIARFSSISRVGITTGDMFCGLIGGRTRRDYTVLSDSVNLASRLMQLAEPGTVLADDVTDRWLDREVVTKARRSVNVKGRVAATMVAELDWAKEEQAPSNKDRGQIFVDRAHILADLVSRRSRTTLSGLGSCVVLRGPPGIGKSALLEELVRRLEGGLVLTARFTGFGRAGPYAGLFALFRRALGLAPDRRPDANALVTALRFVGHDFHRRAEFVEPLVGIDRQGGERAPAQAGPELVRAAAVDLIAMLCRRSTVTLLLDDFHAADQPTQDLVRQLQVSSGELPLLTVIGSRSDVAIPGSVQLSLDELDLADALHVAEHWGSSTPESLVARVGGNPLLVQLAARNDDDVADGRLESLTTARLGRLSESARFWCRQASTAGDVLDLDLAEAEFGPAPVDELVGNGICERALAGSGHYLKFTHQLVREVAYGSLTHDERRSLHGRWGAQLATTSSSDAAEVAFHFLKSDRTESSVTYCRVAANQAVERYAYADAVEWFRQLLPLVADDELAADSLRLAELLLLLEEHDDAAQAFTTATQSTDAEVALRATIGLSRLAAMSGDPVGADRLLRIAETQVNRSGALDERCAVLRLKAEIGMTSRNRESIVSAANELLQLGPEAGDEVIVRAHHALGAVAGAFDGDGEKARVHLVDAIVAAQRLDDPVLSAELASDFGGALYVSGQLTEALEQWDQAAIEADNVGYRRGSAAMLGNSSLVRLRLGDLDGSLTATMLAAQRLEQIGEVRLLTETLTRGAMALLFQGEASEAARILKQLVEIAERSRHVVAATIAAHYRARALFQSGDVDAAIDAIQLAQNLAEATGHQGLEADSTVLRLRLAAESGRHDEAISHIEALERVDDPSVIAMAAYERWRLAPSEDSRQLATELYEQLHLTAPSAQTARRLEALTGRTRPVPTIPDLDSGEQAPTTGRLSAIVERLAAIVHDHRGDSAG